MEKREEITVKAEPSGSGADSSSYSSPPPLTSFPEYNDRTISTRDWFKRVFTDSWGQFISYGVSLFPIATWIYRYNLTWLTGDV